jgi:methylglyoxal synthase
MMAHDAKQGALLAFVERHRADFKDWELLATASMGAALRDATGLRIRTLPPGPAADDVQIGAEIAAGEIDVLIFLRDPASVRPHERDCSALLRIADFRNVALATNLASAECLVRALRPEGALTNRG